MLIKSVFAYSISAACVFRKSVIKIPYFVGFVGVYNKRGHVDQSAGVSLRF